MLGATRPLKYFLALSLFLEKFKNKNFSIHKDSYS